VGRQFRGWDEAALKRLREAGPGGKPAVPPEKKPRGMNPWERAYADFLDALKRSGKVRSWRFESLRFRLADGAWFKPDFAVWMIDHGLGRTVASLEIHEVKGRWREAARVRIKVAADLNPEIPFYAVTKKDGAWSYERLVAGDGR
jgi:hypothetical protein